MTGSVVSNISPQKSNSVLPTGLSANNTYINDTMGGNDTLSLTTMLPTIASADDDFVMQKLALASSMCFLVGVVQVLLPYYMYLFSSLS